MVDACVRRGIAGAVQIESRARARLETLGELFGARDYSNHANTQINDFMIMNTEVYLSLYPAVSERAGHLGYTLSDPCLGLEAEICGSHGRENKKKPVSGISWMAAAVFSNALSEINGLHPVYSVDGGALRDIDIKSGTVVREDPMANGYRLPSLVEWQIAARGGRPALAQGTYGSSHSGSPIAEDVAWLASNSRGHTWPVGTRQPNQLMLYDMSGNVSEWTSTSMELGASPETSITALYYFCGENFESSEKTRLTSCDVHSALVSEPNIGFRLAGRAP